METMIKVNKLSKKYRFGQNQPYNTLRDTLVGLVHNPKNIFGKRKHEEGQLAENEFWALKNISFDVGEGEVLGIIGKNGAGKSTLLKVLSRITPPTEGEIRLRGRVSSLLEVGTGFSGELSGRENIYLNGAILGMTRNEIRRKFSQIVDFAEVGKFIDTPVKYYSSGMYVRLAFAVAAHLEPEILLVDEVLAVGDVGFRKKSMGKMREISKSSGRTILFVSHDMSSIQNICSRAILLRDGKLAYSGYADETIKKYLEESGGETADKWLEWKPEASGRYPYGEIIKLKKFYISDVAGKTVKGRLFNSKQYFVNIDADFKKRDSRLVFAVAFYDEKQTVLFASDINDNGLVDFGTIKPGHIKLQFLLPVELLSNETYEIELLCALHHVGWIFPPNNDCRLKFSFFRDKDDNPYSSDTRMGLLAPVLKWSVIT
ncbi:polysaccharide ABC transporter ATP-binding protein [Patescibacteria group bacterium]|nr:polysaccharide ABC transporter ATP-binding protein [Patescibacteria group bacterium]